jgi:hypothetical protein
MTLHAFERAARPFKGLHGVISQKIEFSITTVVRTSVVTVQTERLAAMCRTKLYVHEHSIAYCRCREAVKLFRLLLPPYSLVETCITMCRSALFVGR